MSGLVSFFEDFHNPKKRPRKHFLQPQHNADCPPDGSGYQEATAFLQPLHNNNKDDNKLSRSNPFPTTRMPVSFRDWSDFQKEWINSYMNYRLIVDPQHSKASPSTSPRRKPKRTFSATLPDHDHDEEGTSQDNENTTTNNSQTPSAAGSKSEILAAHPPHISETDDVATLVHDLDLWTRNVRLGRLSVYQQSPFRLVKRTARRHVLPRTQLIFHQSPELISMSLNPCCDDGPLALLYKTVVSLELSAPPAAASTALRQLATAALASPTTTSPRVLLFLYNRYAQAWRTIVESTGSRKTRQQGAWQVELDRVPPECIVPHGAGQVDWYSRHDLVPYCLCIGDESYMKMDRDCVPERPTTNNNDNEATSTPPDAATPKHRNHQDNDRLDQDRIAYRSDGVLGQNLDEGVRIRVSFLGWVEDEPRVLRQWEIAAHHDGLVKELALPKPPPEPPQEEAAAAPAEEPEPVQVHEDAPRVGTAVTEAETEVPATRATTAASDGMDVDIPEPEPTTTDQANESTEPTAATTEAAAATTIPTIPTDADEGNAPSTLKLRDLLGDRATSDYLPHYLKLNDLKAQHASFMASGTSPMVDIYGIVLGMGTPSLSKRGDWTVSIALVDDSLSLESDQVPAVVLNVFNRNKQLLPSVERCGDVLRIHRAKLQLWKGDAQLMGGKPASYLVVRQTVAGNGALQWEARSSAVHCSVRNQDDLQCLELWKWGQQRIQSHPTTKQNKVVSLADLEFQLQGVDDDEGDLTVMAAAALKFQAELKGDQDPIGYLRIWDGTGGGPSDPAPANVEGVQDLGTQGDPPSAAILKLCQVIKHLEQTQPKGLIVPKGVIGRVVNVAVWEPTQWELIEKAAQPGTFLRLRNVRDRPLPSNPASHCLMMDKKSHMTLLPPTTYEVIRMIEEHNKRLARNEPLNPNSGVCPLDFEQPQETSEPSNGDKENDSTLLVDTNQTTAKLAELLTLPGPAMFSGTVQIMDTIPSLETISDLEVKEFFEAHGAMGLQLRDYDNSESAILEVMVDLESSCSQSLLQGLEDQQNDMSSVRQDISNQKAWNAIVFSTVVQGAKYFVLDALDAVPEVS